MIPPTTKPGTAIFYPSQHRDRAIGPAFIQTIRSDGVRTTDGHHLLPEHCFLTRRECAEYCIAELRGVIRELAKA